MHPARYYSRAEDRHVIIAFPVRRGLRDEGIDEQALRRFCCVKADTTARACHSDGFFSNPR